MQYQNLFTRVQAVGPTHDGVELGRQNSARDIRPFLVHLFGRLGNAQVGPFYLGTLGLISIVTGTLSINIMGFYMLASVGWDPIEFIRQLPWLALEPPSPKYGLRFPPMNEGGWWMFASGLLLVSVLSWWLRTYRRARQLGMAVGAVVPAALYARDGPRGHPLRSRAGEGRRVCQASVAPTCNALMGRRMQRKRMCLSQAHGSTQGSTLMTASSADHPHPAITPSGLTLSC